MAGTFDALAWARDLDMPPGHKALMYSLCSYVDQANSCHPSQARLAHDAGMGERTVRRYLADFEAAGLITRTARSRPEGRGRTSDRITLNLGSTGQIGRLVDDDLPANSGDQPAAACTTNRPPVAGELPENSQRRTSPANADSKPTICATCGCSTDRPGSRRVKRKDVVCLHDSVPA